MWNGYCWSRNCFKGKRPVDVESVKIIERIKRRMHWIKIDATARSDSATKQHIQELEALLEVFVSKQIDSQNHQIDSSLDSEVQTEFAFRNP